MEKEYNDLITNIHYSDEIEKLERIKKDRQIRMLYDKVTKLKDDLEKQKQAKEESPYKIFKDGKFSC